MSADKQQAQGVIAYLEGLKAIQIPDDPKVRQKFITLVDSIHGAGTGEKMYATERHYILKALVENQELQACTKFSIYGAFLDMAVNGLSLDPNRKLAYLMWNNHKVSKYGEPDRYEKRATLQISPYGELYLRQLYGQIRSADNPEVVYQGEDFRRFTGRDGTLVEHNIVYPRPETPIVACYVRLVKGDGTIDYFVMDMQQMMRLKEYSKRKNNGTPNALYGKEGKGPDLGFWIAKTVKHAFRSYPKVRVKGETVQLETEKDDTTVDDYTYEFTDAPQETTTEKPAAQEVEVVEAEVVQEQPKDRGIDF